MNIRDAEIVGICDEAAGAHGGCGDAEFRHPGGTLFTDYRACLEQTKPDLVILCPATAEHGLWTQRVAEFGVNIMIEKPFAASLAEADAMIAAQRATGKLLAINWPIRWYPGYITAKRLIDEGSSATCSSFHHYGGNRGPLFHARTRWRRADAPRKRRRAGFTTRRRAAVRCSITPATARRSARGFRAAASRSK